MEQLAIEELVRAQVAEKFDELTNNFASEIGNTLRMVLTASEVLRLPDIAHVFEDIQVLKKDMEGFVSEADVFNMIKEEHSSQLSKTVEAFVSC